MKRQRHESNSINNPGKPLLKLSVAALVLVAMFCTPARAQTTSDVSSTNLGNGVTLDSVLINGNSFGFLLTLNGNSTGPAIVIGRSTPSSSSSTTPPGTAATTTVFAAYGVLFGTVTSAFATAAAAANGVSILFEPTKPMKPIALGSANNGTGSSAPSVSQIVVTKAGGFASPSLFNESLNGGNSLLTQFGFQNPLAPATGVACSGIATQFDVDSNDNLLIRVFQGNGEPLVDSTVTISLSPLVGSVQATTDANGIASFDGPGNTVPLASLSNITAVTVQFSINGLASSCLVQGNPPPACNTFAELTARPAKLALKSQLAEVTQAH